MKILYFGANNGNSGSRYEGLRRAGHDVRLVEGYERGPVPRGPRLLRALEWRLRDGPGTWRMNRSFVRQARRFRPDVVWAEMGKLIYAGSLRKIKQMGPYLINSYSDDFLDPMKKSRHYCRSIPWYDCIFAARPANVPEYEAYGAKCIGKFLKGFNPLLHYPVELDAEQKRTYGCDVVFAGHWEKERVEVFSKLAERIQAFKIWGAGWRGTRIPPSLKNVVQGRGAAGHEYRLAICGARIALQYPSRWARDTHSSRSFEIPACGTMMVAERTEEHLAIFEENKEAVYFSTPEEMVEKVIYYLDHEDEREAIAAGGRRRCLAAGYSNHERAKVMLEEALRAGGRADLIDSTGHQSPSSAERAAAGNLPGDSTQRAPRRKLRT